MAIIVRMNPSAATWPNCGAGRTVGNDSLGTKWDRAYIASENAVEISFRPGATGEGYYGWQWANLPAPAQGATRVLRAKIKVMSPINWGQWGAKFMVVGDVSNDADNRIISTMGIYQGRPELNVDKNINGHYANGFLTPDQYTAVQIVAAPSSGGQYNFKFYVNGVLTSTSVNFTINPAQWRDFNIGYYGQYGNGGHVQIRFKDVEFADSYDPAYHTGSPVDPPPPVCTYAVAPTSVEFGSAGGSRALTITPSAPTCPTATATSGVPWVTATVSGNSATLIAAVNSGQMRVGTVTVAGQAVRVTQSDGVVDPPPPPTSPNYRVTMDIVNGAARNVSVTVLP